MKPVVALTPGEPAGIGPDICIQVLATSTFDIQPVLFADPALIEERARLLGIDITVLEVNPGQAIPTTRPGQLAIVPVPLKCPAIAGLPDKNNSAAVVSALEKAAQLCLAGTFSALVTGPVQKSIINDAGIPFSGHTEYLARISGCEQVVMMLATTGLRVALLTTHLPLREVADALTAEKLESVLNILHRELQDKFGISKPRILVAGLNPHAGEGGHLGNEEIDIMQPVIGRLQAQGMALKGPLPADTLFTPRYLDNCDAVLCMYHDQGLPVLKYTGFGNAVNITLGLPFIRTSVDHGTALDLAGSGQADAGSLLTALQYTARMLRDTGTYE